MEIDKFLNKTDIQLYRGILRKIYKDFDNIEPSVLGELLDKLKELHIELEKIIQQRKTQKMYDTPKNQRLNKLQIKKDREEIKKMNSKIEWFKECVKIDSMLLKDIYTLIENKS